MREFNAGIARHNCDLVLHCCISNPRFSKKILSSLLGTVWISSILRFNNPPSAWHSDWSGISHNTKETLPPQMATNILSVKTQNMLFLNDPCACRGSHSNNDARIMIESIAAFWSQRWIRTANCTFFHFFDAIGIVSIVSLLLRMPSFEIRVKMQILWNADRER